MQRANYAGKFDSYQIKRAVGDFLLIDGEDGSDLVSRDVAEFKFLDLTKSFDELLAKKTEQTTLYVGSQIRFDAQIFSVKILVRGYNQELDSLRFDSEFLSSPYRYSISRDGIEISANFKKDDNASAFLRSLVYEFGAREKEFYPRIIIYVNSEIIYDTICKSQDGE